MLLLRLKPLRICFWSSGAHFFIRLQLYLTESFWSSQSTITSTITMVLTVLTSFSLGLVSVWLIAERWVSTRYRGKKWLDDALMDITGALFQIRVLGISRRVLKKFGSGVAVGCLCTAAALRRKLFNVSQYFCASDQGDTLPVSSRDIPSPGLHGISPDDQAYTLNEYEPQISEKSLTSDVGTLTRSQSSMLISSENSPVFRPDPLGCAPLPLSPGKQRWRDAYRIIRAGNALRVTPSRIPLRRSVSTMGPSATKSSAAKPRSRPADLAAKLRTLEVIQDLPVHSALVRHLQFSPNGKYLATSR